MRATDLGEFADVVRQYQAVVCAVAYGVTGDRSLSEDVAQETFVAAWRGLSTLRDSSKLGPWLRGIARNLAHKARRKHPAATKLDLDVEAIDDVARATITKDEARVAWDALNKLPEACREALVLYYWCEHSAKEVGVALGITEEAVMQRLSRGRALLRTEVERIVDGTLHRGRPGAALTAAILAAVAAATTGASSATAGTLAAPTTMSGIGKSTLTAIVAGAVASVGAAIAISSGCHGGTSGHSAQASSTTTARDPAVAAASKPSGTAPIRSSSLAPTPTPTDTPDPDGQFMTVLLTSDPPDSWLTPALRDAMATCFFDSLIEHPAHLDITVRDGKIAAVTGKPLDSAVPRIVVIDPQHPETSIPAGELAAWLGAGKPIAIHEENPALPDHSAAMELEDFIGRCASAQLDGQAVAGPDTTHHLTISGSRFTPNQVDHEAYADLDMSTGMSRGPRTAPVTVTAFLDIADPSGFDAKSLYAWTEVLDKHPHDVRLVVKMCPFHAPTNELVAEAIYAANAQGAAWQMLSLVAANRDHLALDDLLGYATALHLDASRMRTELEQHVYRDSIELDRDQMAAMDVHALPSAIVNGKRVHGALPAASYLSAVEDALAPAR